MRLSICAVAALAAVTCQAPAAEPPLPSYRLVDLSDDYVRLYDRTAGMELNERIAAFKAEIQPLLPQFYDAERMAEFLGPFADRIARSFERFPAQRERYLKVAENFHSMIEPALRAFVRQFSGMDDIGDIYLLHSLGEMDGGMRESGGQIYFVFGADRMAEHEFEDETPFFHHELFHRYHLKFFPGCAPLWCQLWTEGLATYVAHELNPSASDAQLLLTFPEPIRAPVDANLAEAVCAVRSRLDQERSNSDFNALFSTARLNERLPPRFGYYIGYLAAREAARSRSMRELAHMNVTEARPVVEAALVALADCTERQ